MTDFLFFAIATEHEDAAGRENCSPRTKVCDGAINPDPNARIFEYADYGILEKFI